MKKIGILGGSFNPIHNGHLLMAQSALEEMDLDQILFMPLKIPAHKNINEILSDKDRVKMIELAISNKDKFSLSRIELDREGTSYTYQTLEILKSKNPDKDYYFIVGGDSFLKIHKEWKNPKKIFQLATILVINRENHRKEIIKKHIDFLNSIYKNNLSVRIIDMPLIEISSSYIRDRIKNELEIDYLLPEKVKEYILQAKLYKD